LQELMKANFVINLIKMNFLEKRSMRKINLLLKNKRQINLNRFIINKLFKANLM
jgi:hypothetical protein